MDVTRMLEELRHRGPDGMGTEVVGDPSSRLGATCLGVRRLAILDLTSAAAQPMTDPRTGNVIVLDGAIHNHLDVRAAVPGGSASFRTRSDTETVMRAYAAWGRACLERLRGSFALAIWDAADGSVFLARDRLGLKPLYLHQDVDGVTFASEVRALLGAGLVSRELDREALAGYLRFGACPAPLTPVSGVRALPPGTWARVRAGRVVARATWWEPSTRLEATRAKPRDRVAAVRAELERAVQEQLLSDVPVATVLDGGVTSAIVTALAARANPDAVTAYTASVHTGSVAHGGRGDTTQAEAFARVHGVRHRRIEIDEVAAGCALPGAVADLDLPTADAALTWSVAQAAAGDGARVLLSGVGGRETFGGHATFCVLPRADRWSRWLGRVPRPLRSLAAGGGVRGRRLAELSARARPLRARYDTLRALWSSPELRCRFDVAAVGLGLEEPDAGLPGPTRVSLLELAGRVRSSLLPSVADQSMAHSVELRAPLLDHRLVELGLGLRLASSGGQRVLVAAAQDLLPPGLAGSSPAPPRLPLRRWMSGPLAAFVREGAVALDAVGCLPAGAAERVVDDARDGRLDAARAWQLAVLGHWLAANGPWEQADRPAALRGASGWTFTVS